MVKYVLWLIKILNRHMYFFLKIIYFLKERRILIENIALDQKTCINHKCLTNL